MAHVPTLLKPENAASQQLHFLDWGPSHPGKLGKGEPMLHINKYLFISHMIFLVTPPLYSISLVSISLIRSPWETRQGVTNKAPEPWRKHGCSHLVNRCYILANWLYSNGHAEELIKHLGTSGCFWANMSHTPGALLANMYLRYPVV